MTPEIDQLIQRLHSREVHDERDDAPDL